MVSAEKGHYVKGRRCRRGHAWQLRAVHTEETPYKTPGLAGHEGTAIKTFALYRCAECGAVDTTVLSGPWTVQELEGSRP